MVFFVAFRAMSIGRKALELTIVFPVFSPVPLASGLASSAGERRRGRGDVTDQRSDIALISYGGSSLLIMSTAIMMLFVLIMKRVWRKRRRLYEVHDGGQGKRLMVMAGGTGGHVFPDWRLRTI